MLPGDFETRHILFWFGTFSLDALPLGHRSSAKEYPLIDKWELARWHNPKLLPRLPHILDNPLNPNLPSLCAANRVLPLSPDDFPSFLHPQIPHTQKTQQSFAPPECSFFFLQRKNWEREREWGELPRLASDPLRSLSLILAAANLGGLHNFLPCHSKFNHIQILINSRPFVPNLGLDLKRHLTPTHIALRGPPTWYRTWVDLDLKLNSNPNPCPKWINTLTQNSLIAPT
jgi:hypothetical protein